MSRHIIATADAPSSPLWTLDDVALVTVLLARPDDFAGMNQTYATVFEKNPPARAVARLGPDLPGILVSIMMTAHPPGVA